MIILRNLCKAFQGRVAVDRVSLEVKRGETLVLLGTSGCGKTTTLRMINRLIEPTTGSIQVDGRDVLKEDPVRLRRKIGDMIQGVGLFPHRTIEENILTVPRLLGWERKRCLERMEMLTALVNLPGELLPRYPHQLSGGQRQRAGLARALAADPPIVLMDEPFGALDPITRRQVRGEFRRMESLLGKTIVLVTHDVAEALELGDRICLMSAGKVEQIGAPADLLFQPANAFVREFFDGGRMQSEWMAVALEDLPIARSGTLAGLPPDTLLSDALDDLERRDEAAFLELITAFFEYKRTVRGTGEEN